MSITVYWSCLNEEWQRAEEPDSVAKNFYAKGRYEENNPKLCLNYCPSFNYNLTNLYSVRSIYDYEFSLLNGEVISSYYDQLFFDKHVNIRSIEKKAFSFNNNYIFFTEEDSLEATAYEHPFLEDNGITKSCILIPGRYDIGKWFRPLEVPFFFKNNSETFSIKNKDVLFYLRFHTNKKIKFKQFKMTDKLINYQKDCVKSPVGVVDKIGSLNNFYKIFKIKKLILKEIRKNLV